MKPFAALLMCVVPATVLPQTDVATRTNRYVIRFDTSLVLSRVTAEVHAPRGRLFMLAVGADMHRRGWAHYVRDLRILELDGSAASYRADTANAAWQLADSTTRPLRLEYSVDLSFVRELWPYGNEQAGTLQGRDLFIVSRALFITTERAGPRNVEVIVPPAWHVAAPWTKARTGAAAYVAADDNALINNSLVVGVTPPLEVRAGSFTFLLANLGATSADRPVVADVLSRVVREYVRIFPQTPPTSYLLTMFRGPQRDAEAFLSSAAFTEVAPLSRETRIQWGGTVAHELFHSWNGAALRPEPYADLQWFSEGFTDYYATRSLARTGVIDEPLFRRRMERTIALYLYFKSAPAFDGVTLKVAGARKGRNRLGVYEGGWVAAFCLDVEIRKQSAGRRTLDDAMRLLYDRFALRNQPYTEADVRAVLREVLGAAGDRFLDRYVVGDDTIPVDECLAAAGYAGFGTGYQGEYYVEAAGSSVYRDWLFGRSR